MNFSLSLAMLSRYASFSENRVECVYINKEINKSAETLFGLHGLGGQSLL